MKNTQRSRKREIVPPGMVTATRIKSAAQLNAMIRQPFIIAFGIDGAAVELEVTRLTPAEESKLAEVMQEVAVPPYSDKLKDHDFQDAGWLAKREHLKRVVRSLRIYAGCAAVREDRPGMTNRDEIHAYVQGLWTEQILELINLSVQAGGLEVAERANFTSAAGLAS